jgi:cobalt-zinc-cadmium efflux system outer membrane protein
MSARLARVRASMRDLHDKMTRPRAAWLAAPAFFAILGGCATYAPAPLRPAADAALAAPDLRALAAAAGQVRHPRLRPVDIDLAKPLSPEALGLIAVAANPDLKAARAKAKVAEAQAFSAGLLPDPNITFGYDRILSGPDHTDPILGQLTLDLAALRDLAATRAASKGAKAQARLDLAWQEWQVAGQARLIAARIAALDRIFAIDQQSRANADNLLDAVLAAASRGDVRADEVQARRIAAADAGDRARQAERDLGAARQDLNRVLGLPPDARLAIAAPPSPGAPASSDTLFAAARAQRLDLRALEAGYDSQEAQTRKAILDQFPNLQLSVTRQVDSTGNQLVGPSITFTPPLWNRNRGGIAVAKATREQLRAEYAARLFATRADIAALVEGLTIAGRQRAEAEGQVGPLRRIAQALSRASDRGDVARAAAETARQGVADKELALATLDQAIAEQSVALDIAVGGSWRSDATGSQP